MDFAIIDDESLYALSASGGDEDAFAVLVERWQSRAYRVARCICRNEVLAEEAVQEAFVKISTSHRQFENRGPDSFRRWFLGVVTNMARMVVRSEKRSQRKKELSVGKNCDTELRTITTMEREELQRAMESALDGMDVKLRTAVFMHYVEGLRQDEIAKITGVSPQMITLRIKHGLELMRKRLAQSGFALSVATLGQALSAETIYSVPPTLAAKLSAPALVAVGAGKMIAGESVRAAGVGLGTTKIALVAALFALAVVFAAFNGFPAFFQSDDSAINIVSNQTAVEAVPTTTTTWDFNDGPPTEWKLYQGNWGWRKRGEINGSGALAADDDFLVATWSERQPLEYVVSFSARYFNFSRELGLAIIFLDDSLKEKNCSKLGMSNDYYSPSETLMHENVFRMEVYVNREQGRIGVEVNGKPYRRSKYFIVESDKDPQPAVGLSAGLSMCNAELDDFSVRLATIEDRLKWARYEREFQAYAAYFAFDCPDFKRYKNLANFSENITQVIGNGKDGSGAALCEGTPARPAFAVIPSAVGLGAHVVCFDWFPLNEDAVQPEALDVFSHPQVCQKLKAPDASMEKRSTASERFSRFSELTPNQWHEVVFVLGSMGSNCYVDGKPFAFRRFTREAPGVLWWNLRLEGRGYLDNLRSFLSKKSEKELLGEFQNPQKTP